MVKYCCAFGCKEKSSKESKLSFHSFPKDPFRRKLWEVKTRRLNFKATDSSRICSKHFTPNSFDTAKFGGTWLKSNAVPTLFDFGENFKVETIGLPNLIELPTKRILSSDEERVHEDSSITGESRRKRLSYYGDFDVSDLNSPTKAQAFLQITQDQILKYKRTINKLRSQNKRLKKRVASLSSKLREKKMISDGASAILKISSNGITDSKLKTTPQNSSMSCSESDSNFSMSDIYSDFTDSEEVPSAFVPSCPEENAEADSEVKPKASFVPVVTTKIVMQESSSSRTINQFETDPSLPELSDSECKQEPPDYTILSNVGFTDIIGLSGNNFITMKKEHHHTVEVNSGDLLFKSPVLIKEEPVTYEEESLDFKS